MKKRIMLFLTIAAACTILAQSMMSSQSSTVESDAAYGILDSITAFLRINNFLTTASIRKFAHFFEFAVFGGLLTSTCIAFGEKIRQSFFKIFFIMLALPVFDEFLQYFSDGRSSQVSDVLLDFSGCVFGFTVTAIIAAITKYQTLQKTSGTTIKRMNIKHIFHFF